MIIIFGVCIKISFLTAESCPSIAIDTKLRLKYVKKIKSHKIEISLSLRKSSLHHVHFHKFFAAPKQFFHYGRSPSTKRIDMIRRVVGKYDFD